MEKNIKRVFVEKNPIYAVEADTLLKDLKENLKIKELESIRILNRYDISGITEEEYIEARNTIFSEPPVDFVYDEEFQIDKSEKVFAIEYLPGQYDQRADSASQCVQLLTQKERPIIKTARLIVLRGKLKENEINKIKAYCINPLEARESELSKPLSLDNEYLIPKDVGMLNDFILKTDNELESIYKELNLAMSLEDLKFCQEYFKDIEKKNPTLTEIKVIDTYWSDHCRHTTFLTAINEVNIEDSQYSKPVKDAYEIYKQSRQYVYGNEHKSKDMSLMDIAVIAMKELRKKGKLEDLEVSEEINACSIVVKAEVNDKEQEWLVMFKNETHNHPTEIEPFGGAATCLGGAIRDPLSGRAYVFGAVRVTGCGDPREGIENTLGGKLPQRKITTGAATGYSSYGNQIGLATGHVAEIYHEDFVAKRLEIGAVIGAVPKENVKREAAEVGDIIILLGGKTGRDGCGGATGSSKEHDEKSLTTCGAEVQKGNPPTERKLQRLFRNPEVSKMIKKCNDFGAGGVCVAIGELASGLEINLDKIPKKYEGLDGTELAISESQERMAVVIEKKDVEKFIEHSQSENLDASVVATVTDKNRLKMLWRDKTIVDINRDFLDTNGVKQNAWVKVVAPDKHCYFDDIPEIVKPHYKDLKKAWIMNLQDLNICSQKGLVENFDSTIGSNTVLMPFGGKYQETPTEGLVMKLPVNDGITNTAVAMTYGYNANLSKWSPFHGGFYAVLEAVTKIAIIGGDYTNIRLTLQEYFEKLGKDPIKWGKPFSALLGALHAQKIFDIPAIGGKDSMSGTFKNINVPPTLVAFAVSKIKADKAVSQEFKKNNSKVIILEAKKNEQGLPEIESIIKNLDRIKYLTENNLIIASNIVKFGGIAGTISKMCFGNSIGFKFEEYENQKKLFIPDYGSVILELDGDTDLEKLLANAEYRLLGYTQKNKEIIVNGYVISLDEAKKAWKNPLENIFPTKDLKTIIDKNIDIPLYNNRSNLKSTIKIAKPKIFIPVFPGTNCEDDTSKAFKKAGGKVEELVFKNLKPTDIEESINAMIKIINNSQIIAIPGGFSGGDEPDGSGKFIATVFRNPKIKEAVSKFLEERDGLIIGICNGFQALVKLGLLPHGKIIKMENNSVTLTYNSIGRHVSCMTNTRISSTLSPWLSKVNTGDVHSIAVSHGEGRFVADEDVLEKLYKNGQIATQYVDFEGKPSMDIAHNPNGSLMAIEGITSIDGRVFGKMGHSERMGINIAKNVPGNKEQRIFEAGIDYFL